METKKKHVTACVCVRVCVCVAANIIKKWVMTLKFLLFLDLLENSRNADYVKFLMALCACNGEAVASNQEMICRILLEKRSHLLFRFKSCNNLPLMPSSEVLCIESANIEPYKEGRSIGRFIARRLIGGKETFVEYYC